MHRQSFYELVSKMKAVGVLVGLLVVGLALANWTTITRTLGLALHPVTPYNTKWFLTGETYRIPPVCHQTWKSKTDIGGVAAEAMKITRAANPHLEFRLYDDNDMVEYIKNNCEDRVLQCYLKINQDYMAARADLFRYCVMFHEGGIYLDIKSVLFKDVFSYIRPSDTAILDVKRTDMEGYRRQMDMGTYEQWLLIYAPGHDYMRRAIARICDEIDGSCQNQRSYTESVWSDHLRGPTTTQSKEIVMRLTGPDGLANAISASILANGPQHRTIPYETFASIVLLRHNDNSRKAMVGTGKHYSEYTTPVILCNPAADAPAADAPGARTQRAARSGQRGDAQAASRPGNSAAS